jgi:hypothetical protein
MGMQPDPGELFRSAALLDLILEKVSDGLIVELDTGAGGVLRDHHELLNEQWIVIAGDAKAADLRVTAVP